MTQGGSWLWQAYDESSWHIPAYTHHLLVAWPLAAETLQELLTSQVNAQPDAAPRNLIDMKGVGKPQATLHA